MKYLPIYKLLILKKLIIEDNNKNLDEKEYSLSDFIVFPIDSGEIDKIYSLIGSYLCECQNENYFNIEDLQIKKLRPEPYKEKKHIVYREIIGEIKLHASLSSDDIIVTNLWKKHIKKLKDKNCLPSSEIREILKYIDLDKKLHFDMENLGWHNCKIDYRVSFKIIKKNFKGLRDYFSNYMNLFKNGKLIPEVGERYLSYGNQFAGIMHSLQKELLKQERGNMVFGKSDTVNFFKTRHPNHKYRFYETLFAIENEGGFEVKNIRACGNEFILCVTDKFDGHLKPEQEESDKKSKELKAPRIIDNPKQQNKKKPKALQKSEKSKPKLSKIDAIDWKAPPGTFFILGQAKHYKYPEGKKYMDIDKLSKKKEIETVIPEFCIVWGKSEHIKLNFPKSEQMRSLFTAFISTTMNKSVITPNEMKGLLETKQSPNKAIRDLNKSLVDQLRKKLPVKKDEIPDFIVGFSKKKKQYISLISFISQEMEDKHYLQYSKDRDKHEDDERKELEHTEGFQIIDTERKHS